MCMQRFGCSDLPMIEVSVKDAVGQASLNKRHLILTLQTAFSQGTRGNFLKFLEFDAPIDGHGWCDVWACIDNCVCLCDLLWHANN